MNLKIYLNQWNYNKYSSLFLILGIVFFIKLEASYIPHFCMFEKILDIKCSFCDLTRSFEELFKGELINSFKINFLSYGLIIFFFLKFILKHKNRIYSINKIEKVFIILCLIQLFNANF